MRKSKKKKEREFYYSSSVETTLYFELRTMYLPFLSRFFSLWIHLRNPTKLVIYLLLNNFSLVSEYPACIHAAPVPHFLLLNIKKRNQTVAKQTLERGRERAYMCERERERINELSEPDGLSVLALQLY